MAEGTAVRSKKNGTITFADSGGTNTYTVAYEEGNFTADTPGDVIMEFMDRGCHASPPALRKVAESNTSIGFSAYFRDVTDGAAAVAPDFIYNAGFVASDWVSTLGASAEVFTFSVTYTAASVDGESAQTLVFNHCHLESGTFTEGDPTITSFTIVSHENTPTNT